MNQVKAWSVLGAIFAIGAYTTACGASADAISDAETENPGTDTEDAAYAEDALSSAEAESVCGAIPNSRAWTRDESDALVRTVVSSFAARKRANDALIRSRGIGKYVGERTPLWRAIAAGNKVEGERIVALSLKAGNDPKAVLAEIKPTSCIGAVYSMLGEAYTAAGRADEWKKIFACGKAYGGVGTQFQRALIRNGWPSPALAFVTDVATLPGSVEEQGFSNAVISAQRNHRDYFTVPLSAGSFLRDFLPSPGSRTVADKTLLRTLGTGNYLSIGTIRAAYHVPMIVPAALIPNDLAPAAGTTARAAWDSAKAAGEPFLMESHSARNGDDVTNFEVKPFTRALAITFGDNIVYSSGTLLFSPNSTYVPGA